MPSMASASSADDGYTCLASCSSAASQAVLLLQPVGLNHWLGMSKLYCDSGAKTGAAALTKYDKCKAWDNLMSPRSALLAHAVAKERCVLVISTQTRSCMGAGIVFCTGHVHVPHASVSPMLFLKGKMLLLYSIVYAI